MNSNPLEFDVWYKDKYDKKVLSGRSGIYAIFHNLDNWGQYDKCLYVGASRDIESRLVLKTTKNKYQTKYFHLLWPIFEQNGQLLFAIKFAPVADLKRLEEAYINCYMPILNSCYGSSYPVNSSISVPKTDTQNSC